MSTNTVKTYMPVIIRRYRHAAGLSQRQLAERAGMVKSYISALELGYRAPNVNVLCNIARVLGVKPGEMLDAYVNEVEASERKIGGKTSK